MRRPAKVCLALGLALVLVAGCSRQGEMRCEPTSRYTAARSVPAVQIPDDLSPPSETDALRLPDVPTNADQPEGECLESPPSFLRGSRLGRGTASASPAETPAAEAQPPEPPADPSRVIEN